jgi:ABC-type transport system substrate-binding protein
VTPSRAAPTASPTGPTPRRSIRSRKANVATHAAVGLVYSKLIDYKIGKDVPFGTNELEGDLATSWTPSADGLTWTFKLRQGVTFQNIAPVNGREFTSADVICTLDAVKARGQQRGDISMIQSWAATDKYTVTMTLGAPYPDLAFKFAGTTSGCCRARRPAARST